MSVVSFAQESQNKGGFYVPQFEIRIQGAGLPRDVLRDVIQCTYHDSIGELDSVELTVNNWDPDTNGFKYVGAETQESLQGKSAEGVRQRLFEPCNKEVEIHMGYAGHLQLLMTGTFTTMEPRFPAGGGSTLTLRALNVLHQLRRKQYTKTWRDKTYSQIAENIATLRDPQTGKPRFPLTIRTNPQAREQETAIPYLAQHNQYDVDFLLNRARERGYVLVVFQGEESRELYFGPSYAAPGHRDVTFELTWGKSLIDFSPTLTTANQIKSVTVRSWDRRSGRQISTTVSLDDSRSVRQCARHNQDLHPLLLRCDPREEVVVDEPHFTFEQARQRACAILSARQREMVTASGTTVGLPDLTAGQKVQITQLGTRFSGTYFVTETTHTIDDSGYTTRFKARREDECGNGGGT